MNEDWKGQAIVMKFEGEKKKREKETERISGKKK